MARRWAAGAVMVALLASSQRAAAQPVGPEQWDPLRAHLQSGATLSSEPIPDGKRIRYVAANGDDSATGTATKPWRTVRHAIERSRKGSVIVVYGKHKGRGDGVYAEQDWGTITTADLTIQAHPGERPVFKGSRTLRTKQGAWKRTERGWYRDVEVDEDDRWDPNPYEIPDQLTDARPQAALPEQLFVGPDAASTVALDQLDADQLADADDRVPADRFFYEPPTQAGAKGRVWVGADPTGDVVEWSTRQQAVRVDPGGRGARIVGISFVNYSPHHGNTLGTIRVLANGVRLVDVNVTRSAGTGIAASGENGTLKRPLRNLVLRRVTASDNGALGAAIGDAGREGADDEIHNHITIEYSRFDGNNREGFDVGDCGDGSHCAIAGIKLVRLNGVVVRYSSVEGNDSTGIWCDLFCERASINGNHVAGNTLSGIYYEVSRRATIASNVVTGNATSGERAAGIKLTGSTGVVVEHNTFHDNRRQQVFLAADHRDDGPAWSFQSDGAPSIRLDANLFSEEAGAQVTVLGTLEGDEVDPAWVESSDGNGYVAGTVFQSPATGDFRVVDPEIAALAGPALSASARSTMHRTDAPTTVGVAYVR